MILRLRSAPPALAEAPPEALRALGDRLAAKPGAVRLGRGLAQPDRLTAFVDGAGLRSLAADPEVVEIVPNTPFALPRSQAVADSAAPFPDAPPAAGAGTVVAILDTGVDARHPALAGRILAEFCTAYASPRDPNGVPLLPIFSTFTRALPWLGSHTPMSLSPSSAAASSPTTTAS